ncbi:endonuclease/exonuclease/phosphatase family protein [Streptomyces sp. NPDC046860]|uniref:endonuclease/exonuclease/phosphatase family protein n=1 Tax=Streptomyces sp. NPDC046860 TaxID=3154495 RepID=UPI0033FF96C0
MPGDHDPIRLILMNLEYDGGPEPRPGVLPRRWLDAVEGVLAPLEPDWVALTELTHSQTRPEASAQEREAAERRWRALQRTLGMRGFRARMGQGRNPVGLLVRPTTFTIGQQRDYPHVHRTPPASTVITLPEVPDVPIITASFHHSFCSPVGRLAEVQEMTALVDKVRAQRRPPDSGWSACWLAGDTNSYPASAGETVPPIDWSSPAITDIVHRQHRAQRQTDGSWASCTVVDNVLLDCGMHDPARYAARVLGQPDALTATAGFARPDQGGPCRIDHFYLDPWSVQAVTSVTVLDMTGLSDHAAVVVDLSRSRLIDALRRNFAPLAPQALIDGPTIPEGTPVTPSAAPESAIGAHQRSTA